MSFWEHCGKSWYYIDVPLAIKNIKDNSIVKCKIDNEEYSYNIQDENNPDITNEMIKNGKWYVYTWSN